MGAGWRKSRVQKLEWEEVSWWKYLNKMQLSYRCLWEKHQRSTVLYVVMIWCFDFTMFVTGLNYIYNNYNYMRFFLVNHQKSA